MEINVIGQRRAMYINLKSVTWVSKMSLTACINKYEKECANQKLNLKKSDDKCWPVST